MSEFHHVRTRPEHFVSGFIMSVQTSQENIRQFSITMIITSSLAEKNESSDRAKWIICLEKMNHPVEEDESPIKRNTFYRAVAIKSRTLMTLTPIIAMATDDFFYLSSFHMQGVQPCSASTPTSSRSRPSSWRHGPWLRAPWFRHATLKEHCHKVQIPF